MMKITFYTVTEIADNLLKFAVIAARHQDKWVLCRHIQRSTWEIPGGHREPGEPISETARRELWEETGAANAELTPLCIYNAITDDIPSYGMLFFAEISAFDSIPEGSEIADTRLFDTLPVNLTYPTIQPQLHVYVMQWLK